MSTTRTRPETTDKHGITHRYACDTPTPETVPTTRMPGWQFLRCPTCGAATLTRTTRSTR
ncbi:hypothetical protein DBB34_14580 [Sphaerisporangium cinnabarinum]|nr:hypothetical protein [Sphaerisporangium cinnabarinum]PTU55379.1 hypothetical protein DBB34_14580 [Sphaerisporangium cinnabarinum]